jgi:hypothetical protein
MPVKDPDAFFRDLEGRTEIGIRRLIDKGTWANDPDKAKAAEDFLHAKAAQRQKVANAEATTLSRQANKLAAIAIGIAILALILVLICVAFMG